MATRSKIIPNLWFDRDAEEAVNFYISVFKNGRAVNTLLNGKDGPGPEGSVLTISFELFGQSFVAINGGPMFQFTEAVSLMVPCETQGELDAYWDALLEGGTAQQCGWLKDKYGLSWQIVPASLEKMIHDPDKAKAGRVMEALLKMVKLDLPTLERAYRQ